MARHLTLATCILVLGSIQLALAATKCWNYNGGFFFTATALSQSCNQVCSDYGGVDLIATRHAGNAVGRHFYPSKLDGYDWMTIECSGVDTNKNWGANGAVPDLEWSHPQCYIHCACNNLPSASEGCDGDPCNGVAEGGSCLRNRQKQCGSYKCLSGQCQVVNFENTTAACGPDTQCRSYSCIDGDCRATPINEGQSCSAGAGSPITECSEFTCYQGECVPTPAHGGEACRFDSCTLGVCNEDGSCSADEPLPNDTQCDDSNACTLNDVCLNGACSGNATLDCGQCGTCNPLTGCQPLSNVTCDDGDDMTCNDTCQAGVCKGQRCPTPEAPVAAPISPPVASPVSRPVSTTPLNNIVSSGSLLISMSHLLLAFIALL